jgi:hypothetical protein
MFPKKSVIKQNNTTPPPPPPPRPTGPKKCSLCAFKKK